jgi:hypothetical protein
MGAEGARLQLVPYFDCTVLCRLLAFTLRPSGFFGATLGLFEQRRQDAGEGDEETDNEKAKAHRAPKRDISGRTRLPGDVGVGNAAGDQSEEDQTACEDEEVASHGYSYFTVARPGLDR